MLPLQLRGSLKLPVAASVWTKKLSTRDAMVAETHIVAAVLNLANIPTSAHELRGTDSDMDGRCGPRQVEQSWSSHYSHS
jgi:hypothetical protein